MTAPEAGQGREVEGLARGARTRVTRTAAALYATPCRCRKLRQCDGHLSERHMIEVGDWVVRASLPPDSEIGNDHWWHAAFCVECAPVETVAALCACVGYPIRDQSSCPIHNQTTEGESA